MHFLLYFIYFGAKNLKMVIFRVFLSLFDCDAKGERNTQKKEKNSQSFSMPLRAFFHVRLSPNLLLDLWLPPVTRSRRLSRSHHYRNRVDVINNRLRKSAGLPATFIKSFTRRVMWLFI